MLDGFVAVCRILVEEFELAPELKMRVQQIAADAERRRQRRRDPLLVARYVKRSFERHLLWYRSPPAEVAEALAAIAARSGSPAAVGPAARRS
jgi:hypothetical protein